MAYRVEIVAEALRDAEEYHAFILKRSHDFIAADTWWAGLKKAVYSLEELPARCPHTPEQKHFRMPLHQLLYASPRVIFRIEPDTVKILRIYHSALRPLKDLRQRPKRSKP